MEQEIIIKLVAIEKILTLYGHINCKFVLSLNAMMKKRFMCGSFKMYKKLIPSFTTVWVYSYTHWHQFYLEACYANLKIRHMKCRHTEGVKASTKL